MTVNTINMKTLILSTLLHYANRSVGYSDRDEFYAIKGKLLSKYGKRLEDDWQHIKKTCYRCDGKGTFHPECRRPEPCWWCHKGVYEEFIVQLHKYQFGKYVFHNPQKKTDVKYEKELPKVKFIEGYIRHTTPKYHLADECMMWLFLLYNRKAFIRKLTRSQFLNNICTPLVALQYVCFFFRHRQWKKWLPKKHRPEQYYVAPYYPEDDELPF